MTEKQEKILEAALQLFAEQGYAATSTSKVAKVAGVSEGLIFRHFKNKEGLLEAIFETVADRTKAIFADIVLSTDPKEVISKALEMPFRIDASEYRVWRLTYAMKWQIQNYSREKVEPLKLAVKNAFEKLGYKNPDAESELILMQLDGAATAILLHEPDNKMEILKCLKAKYNL
ncbi:TetR/AcrR family transcriptional regulator [Owenweeksia hongkongensis]|uniref:TetR/AcrR family transcriptional regulator n=1 Tax=Owenweeksia hongkongensis TaxID=253245 RepID=UPI003A943350